MWSNRSLRFSVSSYRDGLSRTEHIDIRARWEDNVSDFGGLGNEMPEVVDAPGVRCDGRQRQSLSQSGRSPRSGVAHGGDPAAGSPTSERESGPEEAEADRSTKQEGHEVPAPRREDSYDPRPLEDKARRRIAYLLIALLALQVTALLTMVVFDVIGVGEIKEFGVILGPLVTLVAAATSFYYASRRN